MIHRLSRRSRLIVPIAIIAAAAFSAAVTVAAFALPAYARAEAAAPKWHFQWRPNWLPGDPGVEPAGFLAVTALRSASPAAPPGLFIAVDPVTHKPVTPSLEQRKAWAADAARAAALQAPLAPGAFLPVERLPGGGEMVQLNGRFQAYEVARRDANGHFTTDCVSDLDAAKKLVAQPAPAKPTQSKREER
ncbi:MAG TPA: hypothetical protein VK123_00535 [Candidatus Limnocylindrales bacterium]|nr:hypothetical protein [Candidatus Limnocylindrales bacterium]